MKITIDLEVLDADKREWLLDTLNYTQTPFEEEEGYRETVEEYNQKIDEAVARYESGNFITQQQLEKEMKSW